MYTLRKIVTTITLLYGNLSIAQNHPILWTNTFNENFYKVQQVGFSSDSRYLAVGYHNGNVSVFTSDSGYVVINYQAHNAHVFCTKFRPGTTAIASGDKDGNVVLYDYVAHKELYRIKAHNKSVTTIYFSSDGKLLLTGSKDKTIKVWDAATGSLLYNIPYQKGGKVQSLYLESDGNTIVAGITGVSRGLRLFDMKDGIETENFEVPNLEHFDVAPDGVSVVIGSLKRKIYLFNLKRHGFTALLKGHKGWVTDVSYNNTGRVLFTASNDNNVFAWLADGSKHMPIFHTKRDVDAVKCSPDGKYLVILAVNEKLTVMNVEHIEEELLAYWPPVK